jgi:ATPase family AAA domain-containing protein 1
MVTLTRLFKNSPNAVIDQLQVNFEDVIVEQKFKETIEELISFFNSRPDSLSHALQQVRIPGMLLYGPPGTGKTHLTRAIAKECCATMISITVAEIESKWVGEAQKYIKAIFSLSVKLGPSILFIDEADSLFHGRSSRDRRYERSATNQFLQEMDGLATNKASPFVIVATNRPIDSNEAFLRRLPQKLHLELPSERVRGRILKTFLRDKNLSSRVSIEDLARATEGFSGSDLANLYKQACLVFANEQVRARQTLKTAAPSTRVVLDDRHLYKALERIRLSVSKLLLKELSKFSRRFNRSTTRLTFRGQAADSKLLSSIKSSLPNEQSASNTVPRLPHGSLVFGSRGSAVSSNRDEGSSSSASEDSQKLSKGKWISRVQATEFDMEDVMSMEHAFPKLKERIDPKKKT